KHERSGKKHRHYSTKTQQHPGFDGHKNSKSLKSVKWFLHWIVHTFLILWLHPCQPSPILVFVAYCSRSFLLRNSVLWSGQTNGRTVLNTTTVFKCIGSVK